MRKLAKEKQRLLDAIKKGVDPDFVRPEVDKLTAQEQEIQQEIRELEAAPPPSSLVTRDMVRELLSTFDATFEAASPEQRKRLVQTFVRRLELDHETQEVRVFFYSDPQVHSLCAGGGNRTRTGITHGILSPDRLPIPTPRRAHSGKLRSPDCSPYPLAWNRCSS